MSVIRKTISVQWLIENNACNVEACRKYFRERFGEGFTDQTEVELTPEGIIRASKARLTPTNWLARRILTGEDLKEYEQEMNKALELFERRMAPVLAAIVARSKPLA